MRNLAISLGAGDLPATPELSLGYRARIHSDLKTDHFLKGQASIAIGKTGIFSALHESKLIQQAGIDDARTELSYLRLSKWRIIRHSYGGSLAHHFSRSDLYQNKVDASGLYRPVPLGFVDTLIPGQRYRYFLDRQASNRFESDFLDEYWSTQSGMMLLAPIPEHDLQGSLRSALRCPLPFDIDVSLISSITAIWYTRTIEWYAVDDPIADYPFEVYQKYAVIYDRADGKYYLNTNRAELSCPDIAPQELRLHAKRRIDCYLSLSTLCEKRFKYIGKVGYPLKYP
jgi:hypothetical protein